MNPYRKQFDASTAFPFEYVYRDSKSAQNELPDHLHDWHEIVYIYSGCGTFFIDQTFVAAEPGDLLLIPGNTIHRSFPDAVDPKLSTALFFSGTLVHGSTLGDTFSYMRCFELAKRQRRYKLLTTDADRVQIESFIESIHSEHRDKTPGYRHASLIQLQQLLLLVNRMMSATEQFQAASSIAPHWMTSILAFIDENLGEPLGLAQLAARAAVTPSHFSRLFKKLTGLNVTEYVTTKRIIRAKELLAETDSPIAEIAQLCGFESLPHFHRMFKKMTGLTPARYKKI
jgi:AraC-like DNA-binding protein